MKLADFKINKWIGYITVYLYLREDMVFLPNCIRNPVKLKSNMMFPDLWALFK